MNQILAMTRKEFFLWARKPGNWVIVFIVPLLFIWIMGTVFGSSGTPVVTVFVVNQEDSQSANQAMRALREPDNLELEELDTRKEADQRVGAGERMAAVIIPEGFANDLKKPEGAVIEVIIDPARSEQASIVIGLVQAALGPMAVEAEVTRGVETGVNRVLEKIEQGTPTPTAESVPGENPPAGQDASGQDATNAGQAPGSDPAAPEQENGAVVLEELRQFFTAAIRGVVSSEVQESLDNPQVQLTVQALESETVARRPSLLDYLVPGYSLMFAFFLIPSLALTVIEEREVGTLRRLLVAPVPRSRILIGKMAPYFLIAVVQQISVMLVSKFAFGIDLGNDPLALLVLIACSALVMAALGILVAALAQTEGQADGLALVVVLSMAVVSGAMFPSIAIPGLQMVTPHYWAMQGFLNVISRGLGIESVMLPAGALLTMAAVFFMVGVIRFRFE